jgi:hypothetical protein
MDLIHLIQKLIDNPAEREAFQEAPESYIALQEEQLKPYLRSLLRSGTIRETGTVMTIATQRGSDAHSPTDSSELAPTVPPEAIHLHGVPVTMRPRTPFFAEYRYRDESAREQHVYRCMLLRHSYIHVETFGTDRITNMHLNLCYVDPQDSDDQPQVVELTAGMHPYTPSDYNLGDTVVYLTIQRGAYILLRGDSAFVAVLGQGSYYHPETNTCYLVFDNPPEAPAS